MVRDYHPRVITLKDQQGSVSVVRDHPPLDSHNEIALERANMSTWSSLSTDVLIETLEAGIPVNAEEPRKSRGK